MPSWPRGAVRRIDWYLVALFAVIGCATLLPASGATADGLALTARIMVGLLFFLYGARLSPRAAYDGLRHWRLHLPILALTFLVFPLAGMAVGLLPHSVLGGDLATGILFLSVLPSTVQSSVALTSMARGNVAAAICSASFSTLLGVVLTPLLAVLLLQQGTSGGLTFAPSQARDVVVQLLLPFLVGQVARRWIAGWIQRHRLLTTLCDRGCILLVVYSAFSQGMTAGIWQRIPPARIVTLAVVCLLLLGVALALTYGAARLLRLPREDRVTAVFAGSTKSLAGGLPIATVLLPESELGLLVLPLMLYHTLQLVVCTWLARRWPSAASPEDPTPTLVTAAPSATGERPG
ncbi:bile acid:sodium symporter family protein [Streptomyces sp. NPDC048644]|uniref:bile acid:sodium symporter family protein n=1 Tax=Streptomyces sp. NPDC048644 TaxID=3365582 RepID=UPI003724178F